jgi:hypothetical protein
MEKHTYANFSRHAFERLTERTSMKCEEISAILDKGLFVNTGSKPGINKDHLLFYSPKDKDYFVAIKDHFRGTIITILPLDYQDNLAWKISEAECVRAKAMSDAAIPTRTSTLSGSKNTIPPSLFYVSGHFTDEDGNQKTKAICRIPSKPYHNDVMQLVSDRSVYKLIVENAISRNIPIKEMFSVTFRYGANGIPLVVDLQDPQFLTEFSSIKALQ